MEPDEDELRSNEDMTEDDGDDDYQPLIDGDEEHLEPEEDEMLDDEKELDDLVPLSEQDEKQRREFLVSCHSIGHFVKFCKCLPSRKS